MDFKDLVQKRRSYRQFAEEEVSGDDLQLVLRAALMSPTSMNRRSWRFAVVDDKMKIEKLSDAKESGSQFLKGCPLCIVVMANPKENDCWIEDCSIAAYAMQLQAEELGLGTCWVQMRDRGLSDGTSANDIIRGVLGLEDDMTVLCVLGVGHRTAEKPSQDEEKLLWENVTIEE